MKAKIFLKGLIAVVLVTAAAIAGYYWIFDSADVLHHDEQSLLSMEYYDEPDPNIGFLAEAGSKQWTVDELTSQLPRGSLLVYNEDINANGYPEHIIYEPLGDEQQSAGEFRYEQKIRGLIAYSQTEDRLRPILTIDEDGILDENGEKIIEQIRAEHGYGLRTSTYEDEQLYDKPVTLLHLVILDEEHRPASDEIAVYWHPSEERYQIVPPSL